MTRLGTCAGCGGDVMLVTFDDVNGCRFCMGCGKRGPDAALVAEEVHAAPVDLMEDDEEPTLVEFDAPEEPTAAGAPDPALVAMAKGRA